MTVSYELYTLVKGRWQIYVRYEEGRREDAMAEAKVLENEPQVDRVRVVRDQYDPATNEAQEKIIYETFLTGDSQKGKQEDEGSAEKDPSNNKIDANTEHQTKKNKRGKPSKNNETSSIKPVPVKEETTPNNSSRQSSEQKAVATGMFHLAIAISVSTLISLFVGSAAFYTLNALHESQIWVFQSPNMFWGLVGFCFVLAFFSTFRPMFRKIDFGPSDEDESVRKSAAQIDRSPAQIRSDLIQQVLQLQEFTETESSDGRAEEQEARHSALLQATEKQKIVERTANGPQHLKDASSWLLSCMTEGMKTIPDTIKSLDAFNRFGLTLYFAGAGDFVGTRYRCDQRQRSDMLTDRMQLLGHDEATAFAFCANIDEYLMQPKYLKMYDLGRTAMRDYLGDQSIDLKLGEALSNWNKPAGSAEDENEAVFVVVLFTDIVNSTAQTQEIGDEGAMEVVRAHNQIIREALAIYQGTEVKHMGDGIMAVFQNVPNSIQAAIQMQFGIDAYCKTTIDRKFRCRIRHSQGAPCSRPEAHSAGELR